MKFRVPLREPVNGMTHFVGAVLSVVGLVVPLVQDRIMPLRNFLTVALLSFVAACGKSKSSKTDTAAVVTNIGRPTVDTVPVTPIALNLTSAAFEANGAMPAKYTCEGTNISPPLTWAGAPPGMTKSFAIIVEDPDAPDPAKPTRVVSHWIAYNIPPTTTSLAENASKKGMPAGSAQGLNEGKKVGYMGPCPPIGSHRYFFKVFALNRMLDGLNNPAKAQLDRAIQPWVVGTGELIGTYQKRKK